MKLIVGLGNPEKRFKFNRHNIGFTIVDFLIDHYKALPCYLDVRGKSIRSDYTINKNKQMIFLKPLDWMNTSGRSVYYVVNSMGINPKDVMVIYDDMAFDFGQIKIKASGSSGKHNGVQSVIYAIGKEFARFRIGIGHPNKDQTIKDYVLSDFSLSEQKQFCGLCSVAISVVDTFVLHSVNQTMKVFNTRREVK